MPLVLPLCCVPAEILTITHIILLDKQQSLIGYGSPGRHPLTTTHSEKSVEQRMRIAYIFNVYDVCVFKRSECVWNKGVMREYGTNS
jgi:hypothetical protein